MSMKSFDKFCESIIMGEPSSQKAIFDERQNQLRRQYTIEALCFFGISSFVNTVIMECGLQWSESYAMPMVLLAAISFMYWVLRNAAKGTLFGVNGTTPVASTGGLCMAMGVMYSVMFLPSTEEWSSFIVSNGMVSEDLLVMIALVLYFVSGLLIVIAAYKQKKSEKDNAQN